MNELRYVMHWEMAIDKGILILSGPSGWSIVRSKKFKKWIDSYNIDYTLLLTTQSMFPHNIILDFKNEEELSHFILRWI